MRQILAVNKCQTEELSLETPKSVTHLSRFSWIIRNITRAVANRKPYIIQFNI